MTRRVGWSVEVTDHTGSPVAESLPIPAMTGSSPLSLGSVRMRADAQSLMSGSVRVVGEVAPSTLQNRFLRPVVRIDSEPHPLGLLVATADPMTDGVPVSRDVEMIDVSIDLTRRKLHTGLVLKKGQVVTGLVQSRLAAVAPDIATAIVPSGETLRTDLYFPPGTHELEIAQQCLATANYSPLRVTESGALASAPYLRPEDRPVAHRFVEGPDCTYLGGWTADSDWLAIPNVCVLEARGSSQETPLVGRWEDRSTTSQWSIPNRRNREFTLYESGVDATSVAALVAMAERRGREAQMVAQTIRLQHIWLPIRPAQVVEFHSAKRGIRGLYEVSEMSFDMSVGARTSTTLRKVADLD